MRSLGVAIVTAVGRWPRIATPVINWGFSPSKRNAVGERAPRSGVAAPKQNGVGGSASPASLPEASRRRHSQAQNGRRGVRAGGRHGPGAVTRFRAYRPISSRGRCPDLARARASGGSIMAAALTAARRRLIRAALRPHAVWIPQAGISHDAERLHLPPQRSIPPPAKYGGRHTVTLIPGDGIGPELMLHVKEVFRHACVPVDFEEVRVSSEAPEDDVQNAIMAIRRNGVALKGNIETNHNLPPSHKSRNNLIRTSLDLYANVIHCQSLPGVETRHRDIDILIVRENTEGEYSSLEHESVAGVVESLKIITAGRSRRIAHYAFGLARAAARRCVTAVHKANIMKLGDGLFLQCCREVAAEYPEITFNSMIVDNTTMQLVSRPQQFDVMVMPNLYGNIVNNVCAGLVGGPGLVPGANYGYDYAVFETATRNTGKSIANRNIANPTAALLAACMMLDHLRLHSYASTIRQAVLASLDDPRTHTPDIGGQGTTSGAVQSIISHLARA